jgi:hypothetical protein
MFVEQMQRYNFNGILWKLFLVSPEQFWFYDMRQCFR